MAMIRTMPHPPPPPSSPTAVGWVLWRVWSFILVASVCRSPPRTDVSIVHCRLTMRMCRAYWNYLFEMLPICRVKSFKCCGTHALYMTSKHFALRFTDRLSGFLSNNQLQNLKITPHRFHNVYDVKSNTST